MLDRLTGMVIRLRWLVLGGWVALAVACVTLLPTIREAQAGALGDLVPVDAAAIAAEQRSAELFAFPLLSRTQVVIRDPGGLNARTLAATAARVIALNRGEIPGLRAIAGAYVIANVTGSETFARERGTTLVIPLLYGPDVGPTERTELAEGLVQRLQPFAEGASLGVTGTVTARDAQADVIEEHLPLAEVATLAFVLVAVALATRSLVAPLLNLLAVALAYLVSVRLVAAVGERAGISVPAEVQPVMVALLFGVVTDYTLFFLSRFARALPEVGGNGQAAARRTLRELLPILTACGMAVAAGTGALVFAELGFLRAFGPGVAASVVIALAASVTLVPALCAIGGTRVFWPRRPRDRAAGRTRSTRALRAVVRRPIRVAVGCVVVLAAMASGVLGLDLGNPLLRGLPPDSPPRAAYDQAAAGLAPGVISPTVVIVEGDEVGRRRAELARLQRLLEAQPGVAAVVGPASNPTQRAFGAVLSPDRAGARFVVFLSDDPLGAQAVRQLGELRERLPELLRRAALPAATASLAGDTALVQETIDRAAKDIPRIVPAVLVAIMLVLVILLRALVAPLYLMALALPAPLAALGVSVYVFEGLLGQPELTYFVPIAAGVLLVALGSDYNVFLVGRVWADARTRPLREAIVSGAAAASPAITAAGIVLAVSFAALALVPVQAFRELAFVVALGLLIDAFLVRTLLVPAVIAIVGVRSGWPGHALRSGRVSVPSPAPGEQATGGDLDATPERTPAPSGEAPQPDDGPTGESTPPETQGSMTRTRTSIAALGALAAAAVVVALGFERSDQTDQTDDGARPARSSTVLGAPPPVPLEAAAVSDAPGTGARASEARTVELALPAPARFRPGSAERALAEFMDAWYDRAYDRMAGWTTPAFRERYEDPGAELRRRYGTFRLLGWSIQRERLQPVLARFTVSTAYRDLRPQVEREELRLFAVRLGGRWGISLASDDAASASPGTG